MGGGTRRRQLMPIPRRGRCPPQTVRRRLRCGLASRRSFCAGRWWAAGSSESWPSCSAQSARARSRGPPSPPRWVFAMGIVALVLPIVAIVALQVSARRPTRSSDAPAQRLTPPTETARSPTTASGRTSAGVGRGAKARLAEDGASWTAGLLLAAAGCVPEPPWRGCSHRALHWFDAWRRCACARLGSLPGCGPSFWVAGEHTLPNLVGGGLEVLNRHASSILAGGTRTAPIALELADLLGQLLANTPRSKCAGEVLGSGLGHSRWRTRADWYPSGMAPRGQRVHRTVTLPRP